MPVVSFIINGMHGTARLESACRAAAERAGCKPDIMITESGDAGIAAASQAVSAGAELVVAAGGDGTVRGCAQALAGSGVPLGIVPLGTANLLARTLGLPRNAQTALRVALTGRNRLIDIAAADGVPFTAMAGIGLDAAVVAAARFKRRLGWRAYAFSGIAHLAVQPASFTIRIDGREPVVTTARSVIVANCGLLPGGFTILRDARPDDGTLDVGVLAPHGPLGWIRLAGHVIRGDGQLERFPACRVEITSSVPLPRQADGELIGEGRALVVTIQPRSLLVRGC